MKRATLRARHITTTPAELFARWEREQEECDEKREREMEQIPLPSATIPVEPASPIGEVVK